MKNSFSLFVSPYQNLVTLQWTTTILFHLFFKTYMFCLMQPNATEYVTEIITKVDGGCLQIIGVYDSRFESMTQSSSVFKFELSRYLFSQNYNFLAINFALWTMREILRFHRGPRALWCLQRRRKTTDHDALQQYFWFTLPNGVYILANYLFVFEVRLLGP